MEWLFLMESGFSMMALPQSCHFYLQGHLLGLKHIVLVTQLNSQLLLVEEAEKAKAENNNETNRALVKQARDNFETASRKAKEWETGGSQRLLYSLINIILIKSII